MTKTYFLLPIFFILASLGLNAQSDGGKPLVFHMTLASEIDPRTNRYTELALEKAEEMEADYVVIEMDTYGGALNDADDIRTRVLNFEKPIYVYINKDAASAGALISIACDSIYMASGASIGAATVVTGDGTTAPDKYQSYMRSIMRSTAEASGRDPKIAEAMVDQNLEVDSVSTAGQVITFSTSEAIDNGYCEAQVSGLEEIMSRSGVDDYELFKYELTAVDKLVSVFLNPFVSGILILVILGGIYFELQTPGIGFPILAALIALMLYFIPYYLNGLAEHWEIALFFVGIALIGLEVFVIPGFGLAGVLGIVLTMSSLVLVMLNNDALDFSFVPSGQIVTALFTTLLGFVGSIILLFIGGARLTSTKFFQRVALTEVLDKESGYAVRASDQPMIGKRGVSYTILRPSGKVMIEGSIYDAITRGGYVEKDTEIEVVGEEGVSLKVKTV